MSLLYRAFVIISLVKCNSNLTFLNIHYGCNSNQIRKKVTGYSHQIRDPVTCETQNCVYYWKCVKRNCKSYPKCEYVGLTSRLYRLRQAENKHYIRSKNLDKPSGWHFNQPGQELSHFAGLVLEHVKSSDPFVLRNREH